MITQLTDNVMNNESQDLAKAVMKEHTDLEGIVTINENQSSGWIYAADENGECYLFSDNDNKILEKHLSCPNCGYENFESEFKNEASEDCCKEYAEELGI